MPLKGGGKAPGSESKERSFYLRKVTKGAETLGEEGEPRELSIGGQNLHAEQYDDESVDGRFFEFSERE